MYPRLFQFGFLAIPTSGAFTAIAALLGLFLSRGIARRLQLDPEKVWDLAISGILTALLAPRLIVIFTNWSDFLAHPLWMLGILNVRSRPAVASGVILAIGVVLLYAKFARLPIRRTLDALAPALALAFAIASLGSFAAGSDYGTPTTLPWAVTYTKRLASLWSGTPLDIPLHPVQIYEAVTQGCLLVLLLWIIFRHRGAGVLQPWHPRDGEIMGTWLFVTGFSSFLLSLLRGDLTFATAAVLSSPQSIAAYMVIAGGVLWM